MSAGHQALRVLLWPNYNKATLFDDLSGRWTALSFGTALHGGFAQCSLRVPMAWEQAARYLALENSAGAQFAHLVVLEGPTTVWEGRIMGIELVQESGYQGIALTAYGYWSAMRDRLASVGTTGSGTNIGSIIRNLVTTYAPDLNGTANIGTNTTDPGPSDLGTNLYPQDVIVDRLAPMSPNNDLSVWYFAVWENRVPSWAQRPTSLTIDWYVWRQDCSRLSLKQSAEQMRNAVYPMAGTTAIGAGSINADSTMRFGLRREAVVQLPSGATGSLGNTARDLMLAERSRPNQSESFEIDGHIYTTAAATGTAASGAFVEMPKWRVRAGHVIRIQDLLPISQATPQFDALRTFYILETAYDAAQDRLTIVPDRPPSRLEQLLGRLGQMELRR